MKASALIPGLNGGRKSHLCRTTSPFAVSQMPILFDGTIAENIAAGAGLEQNPVCSGWWACSTRQIFRRGKLLARTQ